MHVISMIWNLVVHIESFCYRQTKNLGDVLKSRAQNSELARIQKEIVEAGQFCLMSLEAFVSTDENLKSLWSTPTHMMSNLLQHCGSY